MNTEQLRSDGLYRTTLENGIRIVTDRMPFVRSVALGVCVQAGSGHETKDNNGIAHFLEHMLFKGTKKRTAYDIAKSFESLGGSINASTGKEVSIYSAHILDEHLDVAIDVINDMLNNSLFEKNAIEIEKQVVLSEMAQAQDDPEELIFDHFYKNLFPQHPLGYFIYGSRENVLSFNREDLRSFHHQNYQPGRMVVAAAGNVDHDHLVNLVKKYDFATPSERRTSNLPDVIPAVNRQVLLHRPGLQQAHICLGARTFGYDDGQRFTLALLDTLLGGGMASRLYQNIRENHGFAYSVFTFSDLMSTTGAFGAYIACDAAMVDASLKLLQQEIDKIQQGDLTEAELSNAKSQLRGNLLLGLESSAARMRRIAEAELFGLPHLSIDEIVARIEAVAVNEIEKLVQSLFTSQNTSITILAP